MRDGFEEYIKNKPDYVENLYSCIVASDLLKYKDPRNILENSGKYNSFNHRIARILKIEKSAELNYIIFDCSKNSKKIILISCGATETMIDKFFCKPRNFSKPLYGEPLLTENNELKCKINTGLYSLALRMPIDFLVEQIQVHNYEIVFTGISVGASLAAVVALLVLSKIGFNEDRTKMSKIQFIGFGSPWFAILGDEKKL